MLILNSCSFSCAGYTSYDTGSPICCLSFSEFVPLRFLLIFSFGIMFYFLGLISSLGLYFSVGGGVKV